MQNSYFVFPLPLCICIPVALESQERLKNGACAGRSIPERWKAASLSCTGLPRQQKSLEKPLVVSAAGTLPALSRADGDLAAISDVIHDFLFELSHLLSQDAGGGGQVRVLRLEHLDLLLQPRDPLQLALAALGGGDAVPQLLPLHLDPLLALQVDGRDRGWGAGQVWHLGNRLWGVRPPGRGVGHLAGAGVRGRQLVGVVAAQVGVHGHVCALHQVPLVGALDRGGGRHGSPHQLVLLVQVSQSLDEAVCKSLLLVRGMVSVHEGIGGRIRSRACSNQPLVRLDYQVLQIRRGQLQEVHIGRRHHAQTAGAVEFQAGGVSNAVGEIMRHAVLLAHDLVTLVSIVVWNLAEVWNAIIMIEGRFHLTRH